MIYSICRKHADRKRGRETVLNRPLDVFVWHALCIARASPIFLIYYYYYNTRDIVSISIFSYLQCEMSFFYFFYFSIPVWNGWPIYFHYVHGGAFSFSKIIWFKCYLFHRLHDFDTTAYIVFSNSHVADMACKLQTKRFSVGLFCFRLHMEHGNWPSRKKNI